MASPLDVLLGAQVKDDGVAVTPRRYLDLRTGFTITDDPATDSIRVSVSGGGGGALAGDVNGDAATNVVTQITGDTGDVDMLATSLSWGAPGSSQLKVNAVDGAIELWNNAALALKAHSSAPTIANTGSITQIIGGVRHTVRTIAGNITLDSTTKDFIGWVDASSPRTVTLPAPSVGRTFLLVNVGASAITIARNGSELINGVAANYVVPVANCIVQIVSNGTDWFALPIFDGTSGFVPSSRTINTTAPLTGGGDLSANRTLAVSNATTGAVGVVQLAQDLGGTGALPAVIGLTGTANVVAMHGAAILADAGAGGRLNFSSTGVAVPAGTFSAGSNTAKVLIDSYGAFGATYSGVWLGTAAPTEANVSLAGDNTNTNVNANTRVQIAIGGNIRGIATTNGLRLSAVDTTDPTDRLEVLGRINTGVNTGKVILDSDLNAPTSAGGIWMGTATPTAANCNIRGSVGDLVFNVSGGHSFQIGGSGKAYITTTGMRVGSGAAPTQALDVTGNELVSGYVALGTNPAASGQVRLPNATTVSARNAANSADLTVIGTDSSNNITIGTTTTNNIVTGGQRWTVRSVAADLTIDTTTKDCVVLVDSTAATRTITLPDPSSVPLSGRVITIKRSAGTNNVFIDPVGGALIDGDTEGWELKTSLTEPILAHPFITLLCDGTDWFIIDFWSVAQTIS